VVTWTALPELAGSAKTLFPNISVAFTYAVHLVSADRIGLGFVTCETTQNDVVNTVGLLSIDTIKTETLQTLTGLRC
jgi:hypothetical protein